MAGVGGAIHKFLDDENLEGREAYLAPIPPSVRAELIAEVRDACQTRGYDLGLGGLEVTVTSRMMALDIEGQLKQQGLSYDPAAVECEAFGEGFEQCAMTWKAMVVPYLGLAKPAANVFELSVSAAQFLVGATFRERIALGHDIQLYLWEGADGRPIGLYARAWCRLRDPQYVVKAPLNQDSCEVWTEQSYGTKVWPGESSPITAENGHLRIPVLNGIRRDATDGAFYVIGNGIAFEEFRRILVNSEIDAS